ncbi:hypothetical protein FOV68_11490 [Pantoea sp. paga]|nr:hypothetical protein FOV68_11490 [Pantoea sp. paga]
MPKRRAQTEAPRIKLVQEKRDNNRSQIPTGDSPLQRRRKHAEKKSQCSLKSCLLIQLTAVFNFDG